MERWEFTSVDSEKISDLTTQALQARTLDEAGIKHRRLLREDVSLKAGITFTKPDKPLDAYDTWKEYYSDIDMEPTLKFLGFWRHK